MNSHLNKIGYLLFLNLSIISAILIALNLFGVIDTKFIASNNTFSAFLIIFLTGMIFCKYNLDEHYHRYNSFARSIVDSSQYFFLSLLILIVANKFLKLDILSNRILILTATAIGFGFLAFYKNRDRVEKEIEEEKQKEEDEEKQRYHDFEYKFQNINRIPILRNMVRWMYKEGWVYSVGLILIVIVGAFFYLYGIGSYGFQGDEYYHASMARSLLNGDFSLINFNSENFYFRSILTSILPYLFGKILSGNDFSTELIFRFPLVLMSIFNIILVYLVSKKYYPKNYAIITTTIFAFEIWFVYFARYLRFYSLTITVMLIILLLNKDNKKRLFLSILLIMLSFFLINEFVFLLIPAILFYHYKKKTIKSKKLLFILFFFIVFSTYILITLPENYFNISENNQKYHIDWLLLNYPLFTILWASSLPFLRGKFSEIKLFTLTTLSFILLYLDNLSNNYFTFTFRIFYLLLPFMIISSLNYGLYLFNKKSKFLFLFIIFLPLLINLIFYNANYPGDTYHPTKLIYEKDSKIIGNKDISEFVDNYLENKSDNYTIIHVGSGATKYYLNDKEYISFSSNPSSFSNDLGEFKRLIEDKKSNKILIVTLDSIPKYSELNELIFNRPIVSSVNPEIYDFIIESNFELLYTSIDKESKAFEIKSF